MSWISQNLHLDFNNTSIICSKYTITNRVHNTTSTNHVYCFQTSIISIALKHLGLKLPLLDVTK